MRAINNGIVYDDDAANVYWPDLGVNSWLQIDESYSDDRCLRARLVVSEDHPDRSIITTSEFPQEGVIGMIAWREPEDSVVYYIIELAVMAEYQNLGVGYFLGATMLSSIAHNYGISLSPPPPGWPYRAEFVENIVRRWATDYESDYAQFLWDDGNYYFFSELVELGVLERKFPI